MKIKHIIILAIFLHVSLLSWGQKSYTIDAKKTYQTIDNFGASDAWTAQFFGHFPDSKRQQMADWLFSMETDENNKPKGIGLSLWRFNIGSGSTELGKNSYIPNITRRAECFQLPNGEYDWTKQSGQRWFLQAAKKRGVEQFLAFSISAPTQMTQNGLANNKFRPKDGSFNIKPDKYEDFADFLATVVNEVSKREGIKFQYISPFNEPEWDWDGNTTQEGTPAKMNEIAKTVRLLDKEFSAKNLDTKILVTESGSINHMYKSDEKLFERSNQIERLFDPESESYIGNLKNVPQMMVGHSYWTTSADMLKKERENLRKKLNDYNLGYWQTELCIMGNDNEIGGGGGKDLSMKTALYVARVIHNDLCIANASAWQWWLAMTNSDYKDGLVYVTPNSSLTDGEISDSKLMWTLGNYSRFVRPGAVRVDVSSKKNDTNDLTGIMISAYKHAQDKKMTVVVINYSDKEENIKLKFDNAKTKNFVSYITSDKNGDDLKPQPKAGTSFKIPAKSVVTLVGDID